MTNQHECPVSRLLYWMSVFFEHGYSITETQKELHEQLGIHVHLSEDSLGRIVFQMEDQKFPWIIDRKDIPVLQADILEYIKEPQRRPCPTVKLFDEE